MPILAHPCRQSSDELIDCFYYAPLEMVHHPFFLRINFLFPLPSAPLELVHSLPCLSYFAVPSFPFIFGVAPQHRHQSVYGAKTWITMTFLVSLSLMCLGDRGGVQVSLDLVVDECAPAEIEAWRLMLARGVLRRVALGFVL